MHAPTQHVHTHTNSTHSYRYSCTSVKFSQSLFSDTIHLTFVSLCLHVYTHTHTNIYTCIHTHCCHLAGRRKNRWTIPHAPHGGLSPGGHPQSQPAGAPRCALHSTPESHAPQQMNVSMNFTRTPQCKLTPQSKLDNYI